MATPPDKPGGRAVSSGAQPPARHPHEVVVAPRLLTVNVQALAIAKPKYSEIRTLVMLPAAVASTS